MPVDARARLMRVGEQVRRRIARWDAGDPTAWEGDTFDRLASGLLTTQRECVPAYSAWCDAYDIAFDAPWQDMPGLPTGAFRRMPGRRARAARRCRPRFTSSGTTDEAASRHALPALALYETSLLASARRALVPDLSFAPGVPSRSWGMLQLVPSACGLPGSSLAHMLDTVRTQLAPRGWVCAHADAGARGE